jgi:hypothetical protein
MSVQLLTLCVCVCSLVPPQTIMTSYCLDGISRNFSGAAAADSPALQQNSSHLIAKVTMLQT